MWIWGDVFFGRNRTGDLTDYQISSVPRSPPLSYGDGWITENPLVPSLIPCLFACFYKSVSCVYAFFSTCLSTGVACAACFVFCLKFMTNFLFSFFFFCKFKDTCVTVPIDKRITLLFCLSSFSVCIFISRIPACVYLNIITHFPPLPYLYTSIAIFICIHASTIMKWPLIICMLQPQMSLCAC